MPLFNLTDLARATEVVRRQVPVTPAYEWPLLGEAVGARVWVKHENSTPTGAFKVRGGLVYVDRLREERPKVRGLISATRGNHGQSLAYAGRSAGTPVVIVVPEGNSTAKNAAMVGFGAELVIHGHDFQESLEYAMEQADGRGLEPVPPFHRDLVLGVSTYARELFDATGPLDAVYVPVGMGSGICGLVTVRELLGLPTEIIGAVSDRAPALALSLEAGRVVSAPAETFVDGVACRTPDPLALEIIAAGAARVLRVPEATTAEAMRLMLETTRQMPEPAGAIALGGLLLERELQAGKRVAVVMTGGNCDTAMLTEVLAGRTPTV